MRRKYSAMYSGWSPRTRYSWIHATQAGTSSPACGWLNCAMSAGMYSSDEAKMTGTTPAMLTLIGMYVDVPPYMRRPTMRLAYCTGMRRWDCSTKTTAAMTNMPRMMMSRNVPQPLFSLMAHSEPGKPAAMDVKIMSDMPLPTPLSVTSSPNHMMRPVPAVIVRSMMTMVTIDWSTMIVSHWPPKRLDGLRAKVTRVADWRIARPIVR